MKAEITEQTETAVTPRAAIKAHNASTHALGLRSVAPHEKAAYREHAQALQDSLEPQGALEVLLCERIALTLWRLGRVMAYEAARVGEEFEEEHTALLLGSRHPDAHSAFKAQYPDEDPAKAGLYQITPPHLLGPKAARWELKRTLEHATALSTYGETSEHKEQAQEALEVGEYLLSLAHAWKVESETLPSLETVDREHWWRISNELQTAGKLSDKKILQLIGLTLEPGETPGDVIYEVEWTPEQFTALLTYLKKRPGVRDALWSKGLEMRNNGARAVEVVSRVDTLKERAGATLPPTHSLEKIQRYEAHLERILKSALNQLEVWQARRRGEATPLARLEVSGLE